MFKGSSSGERMFRAKIQRQGGKCKGHGVCDRRGSESNLQLRPEGRAGWAVKAESQYRVVQEVAQPRTRPKP